VPLFIDVDTVNIYMMHGEVDTVNISEPKDL
jgi:hypothetical protein